MTLYDTAINMARQERGLIAFARENNIDIEIDGQILGLKFMSVGVGLRHDAAMLEQVTKQLIEAVGQHNDTM